MGGGGLECFTACAYEGFNCGKAAHTQRGHGVMLGGDEFSLLHGQLIGLWIDCIIFDN